MNRCGFCGKKTAPGESFCSQACQDRYGRAIKRDTAKTGWFLAGILLGIGVLFAGVFSQRDPLMGGGLLLLGATVVLLPLATPETVALLGWRRARLLARVLGLVLLGMGVWTGWF